MIIDVSIHNGGIDWDRVKASGVDGAIIRCGYGRDMTKQDDTRFKANIEGALARGLRVGVYLYSYAKTVESAKSEAEHVLRLITPYKERLTLPVYYDLEEEGTERGARERAIAFGDIIEANGLWCGIYASLSWWATYLYGLDRFTKWVACWGSNNGKPNFKPNVSGLDLWQYTSRGRVDGINGLVDLNELLNPNIGGYIKPNGSQKPKEPIIETPKPIEEPKEEPKYTTYKIKKGDTLSKIAKKFGTTTKAIKAANPDKIKDVNKIYAGDIIKIPE